jgi:transcriptional regulator with XRE-family HTH domain
VAKSRTAASSAFYLVRDGKAHTGKRMNWEEAISELLQTKKMSLRQLAVEFGMGNVFLSEVARGSKPASPMLKLKILTALGRSIGREELILMLPDDVAAEVRKRGTS